ncbi:hypothetical protein [Methylopila sp. M107]|uniref:hypothetical protein n=1 Tax=Methylopila sp. M107 TaxID=1101190 RepID=UPI0003771028|nr:hypothetical protein [Methylopila sp. M107]
MDASLPISGRLAVALLADDDMAILAPDVAFDAQQLHDRSRFCWAVVGSPSGAIAMQDGALLMRLREDEARRLAMALTEAATRAATEH